MDWGQTISQSTTVVSYCEIPTNTETIQFKVLLLWEENQIDTEMLWAFSFYVSNPSPSFHTWICIFCLNCCNQTVGLGWVLRFKAVKEHQQAQILEGPAAKDLSELGNSWMAFQFEMEFYIYHPKIKGNLEETFTVVVTPALCPLSPAFCVGEWGSPFHMTTLLVADCGGENLVFQLQLPIPVLKSAFVLPAYSQGHQEHLEMFL